MKKIKPTYLKCVLRSELVALMKANGIKSNYHEPALILNQALYWSERVNDVADMLEEERKRDGAECEPTDCMHGWIYKSAEVWIEDTMLGISVNTMRRHLLLLEEFGYLMSRSNPKNKWDKILQYRINLIKIMQDLEGIGLILNGYSALSKYQDASPNCQVGGSECQGEAAILDIILESSLETLKTKHAAPQTLAACAPLSPLQATTKTVRGKDNFELNPNGDKWQNAATRCLLYFYQLTNRAITNDKAKQKRYFQIVTKWWADAKGKDNADTENRLRTILEQVIRDTNKAQKSKDKTERLTLVDPQSYDKYVTGALSEMRGREQYHGG